MKKNLFYSLCSVILLLISFKPFIFWPISFFALVPYFYILNAKKQSSLKNIFLSSFFVGGVFSLGLLSLVISKFPLILLITTFIYGVSFGLVGILYIKLKRNCILDVFIFASLWVVCEWARQLIFQDYDYTTIAYTAYTFKSLLSFASIGGRYLVSFIIATTNAFIGYFIIYGFEKKAKKVLTVFVFALLFVFIANKIYLNSGNNKGHEVSFAGIQTGGDYDSDSKTIDGIFVLNPDTKVLIDNAIKKQANYIIYPYNLVPYKLVDQHMPNEKYADASFEEVDSVLEKIIPQDTKFVFWPNVVRKEYGDNVFDETVFWKNGHIANYYQKRNMHPFYDITSEYFREAGIYDKPYEFVASNEDKVVTVDNERFGNLSCSEVNYSSLARHDEKLGANIILSIGYSSVFEKSVLGDANLILSQFRAVETNLPIIRSDMVGPSALINKNGTIVSKVDGEQNGILNGKLFIEENPPKTLYVYWGDYFFITLLSTFLFYLGFVKYQSRIK